MLDYIDLEKWLGLYSNSSSSSSCMSRIQNSRSITTRIILIMGDEIFQCDHQGVI